MEARTTSILARLGFSEETLNKPVHIFSGGWWMRISLAKLLLMNPNALLLDEPTNHLDLQMLIWLEKFIEDYHGTLIIVFHDRYFLDRITNHIAEIHKGHI
ncbi:MAG: ATP-binding cassette domain-containing protein [Candidatus Marinimicrobia bacterium]|nr:ATP-binding cassette domain-containing protein [Candidatus Neomarinimicrobiota bacterium]